MLKETIVNKFKVLSRHFLEGLKKIMKNISTWSLGRDLNPRPPKYEAGMLIVTFGNSKRFFCLEDGDTKDLRNVGSTACICVHSATVPIQKYDLQNEMYLHFLHACTLNGVSLAFSVCIRVCWRMLWVR
jgi:hypothetical protein